MEKIEIMIIEDDSDDVMLFQEALNASDLKVTTMAFFDAEAAFANLQHRVDRLEKLPDLIVLDLNLPLIQGHDALATLKANAPYHHIPVIILSVSKRAEDSEKSFLYGAAGYFIKPMHTDEWIPIISFIRRLTHQSEKNTVE